MKKKRTYRNITRKNIHLHRRRYLKKIRMLKRRIAELESKS